MGNLVKAKLKVYGAGGKNTDTVDCLINPSEYTIKRSVRYATKYELGRDNGDIQYIHGESPVLSLSLYFDTTEELKGGENQWSKEGSQKAVTRHTRRIVKLAAIDGSIHRPPLVEFSWGNLNFKGVITSVNQSFSYFARDGTPLRAKLDIEITSSADELAARKSPFESPDRSKYRTAITGMTLWQMAVEEYGDGEGWKEIARANHLQNPLDVRPGDVLKVPPRLPAQ